MFEDAQKYLYGLNVYMDTAFYLDKLEPDTAAAMIRKHGADKFLFAVDAPWGDQGSFTAAFHALPLDPYEKEFLSHLNASRLLGL